MKGTNLTNVNPTLVPDILGCGVLSHFENYNIFQTYSDAVSAI